MPRPLPQRFFARDVVDVARDLIGAYLVRDEVTLRVTEVEAYGDASDSASHARAGRTARTAPMFGPAGRAYVYLCYGVHQMLNVSTGPEGQAGAVLIRGAEVVRGEATTTVRRGGRSGPRSLAGPGKVGQALALDPSWSHHRLYRRGELWLAAADAADAASDVVSGPRIGIGFADPRDRGKRWRFADAASRAISHLTALS